LAVRLGQMLAAIHRAGVALCDGHAGHVLVEREGQLALVDLDFAVTGPAATEERRGFDLAYAATFLPDDLTRQALLHGYGAMTPGFADAFVRALERIASFGPLVYLARRAAARSPDRG